MILVLAAAVATMLKTFDDVAELKERAKKEARKVIDKIYRDNYLKWIHVY